MLLSPRNSCSVKDACKNSNQFAVQAKRILFHLFSVKVHEPTGFAASAMVSTGDITDAVLKQYY
ncbi:MAG: hypothetical protein PHP85_10705 [Gallionella sp.]|nr:hypothetical protein [Gallionella sp.]